MKAFALILALALLKVSMARPQEPEFSIDMYEGSNHLRYQRSDEAAAAGTVVTVEHADSNTAHHDQHRIDQITSDKVVSVAEAMKTAQEVVTHLEEETSKDQQMTVQVKHDFEGQESETVKEAHKEAAKETVKSEETAVHQKKTEKADHETVGTSVSKSTIDISTPESRGTEATQELAKPRYINKYGDILTRINKDKVNPLASKSRSKSSQSSSASSERSNSKKLSHGGPSFNPSKVSMSVMMVNGKEVDVSRSPYGSQAKGLSISSPAQGIQAFGAPQTFRQGPSYGAAGFGGPTGFGAPASFRGPAGFGAPAPAAFGAHGPTSVGYAPMYEQTSNLGRNIQPMAPAYGQSNGFRMLSFAQPPAFQPRRF